MPTDEKTITQEVAPITAVVIGGTGDSPLPKDKALATTPHGQPNIIVQVVTPFMAILIRAVSMFCTTLLSIVTVAMPTGLIPASTFGELLWKSASFAVAATVLDLFRNVITLFGKLERDYPLLRV